MLIDLFIPTEDYVAGIKALTLFFFSRPVPSISICAPLIDRHGISQPFPLLKEHHLILPKVLGTKKFPGGCSILARIWKAQKISKTSQDSRSAPGWQPDRISGRCSRGVVL
jgi:hypothetical protein